MAKESKPNKDDKSFDHMDVDIGFCRLQAVTELLDDHISGSVRPLDERIVSGAMDAIRKEIAPLKEVV